MFIITWDTICINRRWSIYILLSIFLGGQKYTEMGKSSILLIMWQSFCMWYLRKPLILLSEHYIWFIFSWLSSIIIQKFHQHLYDSNWDPCCWQGSYLPQHKNQRQLVMSSTEVPCMKSDGTTKIIYYTAPQIWNY